MTSNNKRIEWIDAMRGFTMILVIANHILTMCFINGQDIELISINNYIGLFRMPLFFTISGFLFFSYKKSWSFAEITEIVIKKARIQLIPTLVFCILALLFGISSFDTILHNDAKGGFWFTFVLFFYFTFVSISLYAIRKIITYYYKELSNYLSIIEDIFILFIAFIIYAIANKSYLWEDNLIVHLLSLSLWTYYPFFVFGIILKKHQESILNSIDRPNFITGIILFMFTVPIYLLAHCYTISNTFLGILYFIGTGLSGSLLIIAFFKRNELYFNKNTTIGYVLQYTGKRTLDIYLLHYFFLPTNLKQVGCFFAENNNIILEFTLCLVLSLIVLSACLLMSNIIRLSPFLAKYLFGKVY